jgi:hypothetical protein
MGHSFTINRKAEGANGTIHIPEVDEWPQPQAFAFGLTADPRQVYGHSELFIKAINWFAVSRGPCPVSASGFFFLKNPNMVLSLQMTHLYAIFNDS